MVQFGRIVSQSGLKIEQGACSRFVASMKETDRSHLQFREGTNRLPAIAPGKAGIHCPLALRCDWSVEA